MISITCALLATLLQQWARRYLKVTQPRYSPHKRARIRAFFAEGVDKFLLPWAVEALPTMLHLSLFLFFAGLAVFLWNINLTIFKLVLSWIGLCTALYGCITFIPIFCHDSPYHTPLSLLVWHFTQGIRYLTFRALEWIIVYSNRFSYETDRRFQRLAESYSRLISRGMQKMAEETALNSPPEIDTRAFLWTFDCLDEDHELELFFAGLPGFRSSKMVKDPLPDLTPEQQVKLLNALIGLSDRTSSSDLLPEPVKIRRTVICGKALGPEDISRKNIKHVLRKIVSEDHYGLVKSVAIVPFVKGWDNGDDEEIARITRAIVSSAVAGAQRRDGLWFAVAADAMGVPESLLRSHATHGSDLSLAILIHVVRQQFNFLWRFHWPEVEFSKVLEAASKFDVLDTSPELQHEFCALWNQIVDKDYFAMRWNTLRPIRNVYLTLHLHTDYAPTQFTASTSDEDGIFWYRSTYPLCNIPCHYPDSTPRNRNVSAPMIAIPRTVPHDNAELVPFPPPSTPDVPPPSLTAPVRINESAVLPPPSSCAHQTATENFHNSPTSPDPTTATATRDNLSAQTMPHTGPETSTSTPSVCPSGERSLQNVAGLLVHPDVPEAPSPASREPVLNDITGSSFFFI